MIKQLFRAYHFVLAFLGALWYGFPSRKLTVIGVTGTKGKTTTVELLYTILSVGGKKVAMLSSVYEKIGDQVKRNITGNSMPGRFFLQRFLLRARKAGCTYAIIEVTSQGIDYHRHRFIQWAVGIMTNIAPEHIESHGSFENYREAKALFLHKVTEQSGIVFLNREDQASEYFFQNLPTEHIRSYSTDNLPTISQELEVVLLGDFNKQNLAAAIAVVRFLKISESQINESIKNFKGVPGRSEFIQIKPFAVVVDYAHTPDSLGAIYSTLKPKDGRKLICILGAAGGGRDKWKRPLMGGVAAKYCDYIILTNEDPYNEDPNQIVSEIQSGISNSQFSISKAEKILDRKEAIAKAISFAQEGDVVVMTGKGSETSIHAAGGKVIPWSDREVVERLLK